MMVVLMVLVAAMLVCSVGPAALFMVNLNRYLPPRMGSAADACVEVLIPARDEERNIAACVKCVLASRGVAVRVMVLDDASTDRTSAIVRDIVTRDGRVLLVQTQELPAGWNGKQHACWLLAQQSSAELMLFLDADVRLEPDAVAACVAAQRSSGAALLSGFPRQIAVGWMEQMLLPLIHFVLLAFLPLGRMRATTAPAYAAGCGQFMLVQRAAYFASGGHAAIRGTRHDGLRLPKVMRAHGFATELVDLTGLASVRMYESARQVWTGLAKNATEGLGAPTRIVPLTAILLLGQVVPSLAWGLWVAACVSMVVLGATLDQPRMGVALTLVLALAMTASYLPRLLAVRRFRQPWLSALLHPLGIVLLLLLQWYALGKQVFGSPVAWRQRKYASGSGEQVG